MTTTRLKHATLCAVLAILTLTLNATAREFRDVFDGPTDDGMPCTWAGGGGPWGGGSRVVTEDGWEWTPDGEDMAAYVTGENYSDVSVHTQLSFLDESGDYTFIVGREGYYAGIALSGEIGIWSIEGWLAQQNTDLDVLNDDVHLQFDLLGDSLSFTVWSDADGRPSIPQIQVNDDYRSIGRVGLWHSQGQNTPVVFRYFHVQPLVPLQPGDANMDYEFNQLDLVQVLVAAKYLSGTAATWGEGDWNGAPGGTAGDPPVGDGLFDQLDIIAALTAGWYLKSSPYAAIGPYAVLSGSTSPFQGLGDEQTSIVYDPVTGEIGVDAPTGAELTSINIDSAGGIFTGDPAENLGGSFDNDADNNIFKATFGSSFGSLSFGNVAQTWLSEDLMVNDLTVVGSLNGGGGLGDVDLIYMYVPEPSAVLLLALGVVSLLAARRRR